MRCYCTQGLAHSIQISIMSFIVFAQDINIIITQFKYLTQLYLAVISMIQYYLPIYNECINYSML
jgi:hypothetical protein